jgi:hypothetical protein
MVMLLVLHQVGDAKISVYVHVEMQQQLRSDAAVCERQQDREDNNDRDRIVLAYISNSSQY